MFVGSEETLDDLWRQLLEVVRSLEDTPPESADLWLELRSRRDDLRRAIAALRPDDPAAMQSELSRLMAMRDALLTTRPNVAAMGAAGQGYDGLAEAQEMAWEFDRGQGRHELESRIRDLERRIEVAERRNS